MCFLFSDDEFSAAALLSEESRIKNAYTDGTKFYACIIKYTCPKRYRIFAGVHTGAPLQTLSQICTHCKNLSFRNSAQNQCEHKSKTVRQGSSTSRRSLLRVESTLSKDVYVFFILRRRVQRCCTAVRGVKNKKYIHRRHRILCVHNKIYLSETVQNICGRPHRVTPTNPIANLRTLQKHSLQPETTHTITLPYRSHFPYRQDL